MTCIVRAACRYKRRLMVSGMCGLFGLAAAGPTLADDMFNGVYGGKRVLTKGTDPACAAEEAVSVTIDGEVVRFTDSAVRNFPMGFEPHPDGSFRDISVGVGGGYVLIEGRIVGNVLDADVTDGPCEHHWHLTKKPPRPASHDPARCKQSPHW
jgi:hypothetical protein